METGSFVSPPLSYLLTFHPNKLNLVKVMEKNLKVFVLRFNFQQIRGVPKVRLYPRTTDLAENMLQCVPRMDGLLGHPLSLWKIKR